MIKYIKKMLGIGHEPVVAPAPYKVETPASTIEGASAAKPVVAEKKPVTKKPAAKKTTARKPRAPKA